MHMANKTIYVSEDDEKLFEDAKQIAGTALSAVISKALREYVTRHTKKEQGMKEISVLVGKHDAEREMRFVGTLVGEWTGFSDDKVWWMGAKIYHTQKRNWAIHLTTECKATLLTNRKAWKTSGDYLTNPREAKLLIGSTLKDFNQKVPAVLLQTIKNLIEKDETPIEYLDI